MQTTDSSRDQAAPVAGGSPAGSPARRTRDASIDNARFVLIALVVVGHALTTMREIPAVDVLYSWIYMFHMPAFVFLSGLVLRSDSVDARQGGRIISTLLAPLVIFTVLYQLAGMLLGQPVPTDGSLLDPYWLLWFIVALTLWRLAVPLLRALRWPVATTLVVSTVMVLLVDLPSVLSLDRFFVLLPFFAAGLMLTPDRIAELRTRAWRLAGAGILVASVFVAFWVSELPGGFQTFSDAVGGGEGGAIGDLPEFLAMYAIAAAMIVALLALVPTGRSVITTWGTRTMYVYLLHGFVIRGFRATELSDVLASPAGVAIVIVAALALTVLLSSDAVVSRTRRLVEPDVGWLLRSEVDSHPLRGRQAGAASTAAGAANGAVEPAPAAAAQLGRAPLATAGSARSGS